MSSKRHDLPLQFKGSAVASLIFNFHLFIGVNFPVLTRFLLLMEKEIGLGHLHLVLVHRNIGVRFGSPAPSLIEGIGLKRGPICQVN